MQNVEQCPETALGFDSTSHSLDSSFKHMIIHMTSNMRQDNYMLYNSARDKLCKFFNSWVESSTRKLQFSSNSYLTKPWIWLSKRSTLSWCWRLVSNNSAFNCAFSSWAWSRSLLTERVSACNSSLQARRDKTASRTSSDHVQSKEFNFRIQ